MEHLVAGLTFGCRQLSGELSADICRSCVVHVFCGGKLSQKKFDWNFKCKTYGN